MRYHGDLEKILHDVLLLNYREDSTGVKMAFGQHSAVDLLVPMSLLRAGMVIAVLRKLSLVNVMVNIIPPGVVVPLHVDHVAPTPLQPVLPKIERWHLPLKTNPNAIFTDTDGDHHFPLGEFSGPVKYWRPHSVRNLGTEDRVHAIFDLDTSEPQGGY